uniref:reverse transcriptase domain-containing protein n=1 Tax=Trichocoleus desertorum TaxID=1481672 RepID=UPI0025B4E952|nr:reverse transcriptase domain-containing protein [Trichocoleus desertorum]
MADLVQQFLAATNFELAWDQVATNQGCAGVDGETIAQFGVHKDAAIATLIALLVSGKYRPLPLRQLFIPKAEGEWRELGVPTVRDRLVQQALLQVLHPLMEREFEECSFAYRPGRSHLMAVQQVAQWRDRGYEWVLDADIVQYFEQVQHRRLLAEVEERLVKHVAEEGIRFVLNLIKAWISVGVLAQAGLMLPQKGIPQGAVISPLLANIYLDDFDAAFANRDLRLVRFSDDFVLLARRRSRLVAAKAEVEQLLSTMGLQLHADKTRITNFEQGFRFLGHAFAGDVVVRVKKPTDRKLEPLKREELRLVHAEASTQPTVMQQALVEALKTAGTPIPPPLFVVLGYAVRPVKSVEIDSDEVAWKGDMSTLYLVQQGTTLRKEQGRFLIQPPKEAGACQFCKPIRPLR